MRSILPHGKSVPEWCPVTLMLHPYWGRISHGQQMHQRGVPSLLRSTFQSLKNATVLCFLKSMHNPCWGQLFHENGMRQNGVLWVWSMPSLLRSTLPCQKNAPEWCPVKSRCMNPIKVDIHPWWGRHSHWGDTDSCLDCLGFKYSSVFRSLLFQMNKDCNELLFRGYIPPTLVSHIKMAPVTQGNSKTSTKDNMCHIARRIKHLHHCFRLVVLACVCFRLRPSSHTLGIVYYWCYIKNCVLLRLH